MRRGGEKWQIWLTMAIFAVTMLAAVVGNSLMGYGWHINYSISRYVGLETWSAMLFALGNFVVAGLIGRYLYQVGEAWQMPRWFYWVVVLLAAGLVGLSVCPLMYFDHNGIKSTPTMVHEICSRTMFAGMLVVAGTLLTRRGLNKVTKVYAAVFVVYGLLCCVGYLTKAGWFIGLMLFCEAAYIWGFMGLCIMIRERRLDGKIKTKA